MTLIYSGPMEQDEYRSDRTLLTHSRSRKLLPPSCPAIFKWDMDHPRFSDTFDFGKAAHRQVLGAGDEIEIVDADDWRTKAARDQRDEARAAGRIPVLAKDAEVVSAMAEQIKAHPLASRLFSNGQPEQAILWHDKTNPKVKRGTLLDWLPNRVEGRRLILSDYKTTSGWADPDEWVRKAGDYGYHSQAAWNIDAVLALYPDLIEEDIAFLNVVQMKNPPYLVSVPQLQPDDIDAGREQNARAIAIFHECMTTEQWPGYPAEVAQVTLPPWAKKGTAA